MFVHMPSPGPMKLPEYAEPVVKDFLKKAEDLDCPFGMKTTLYQYQKVSEVHFHVMIFDVHPSLLLLWWNRRPC